MRSQVRCRVVSLLPKVRYVHSRQNPYSPFERRPIMLRKIAFLVLCALCLAAGQDRLLGTWEYSTDSIEVLACTGNTLDTLEELTIETRHPLLRHVAGAIDPPLEHQRRRVPFTSTKSKSLTTGDDLDYQTPRFTVKGEPVIVIDYPGDDLDDGLAELYEDLAFADSAIRDVVNYSGTGTWHTAGDSLWLEVDEVTISISSQGRHRDQPIRTGR